MKYLYWIVTVILVATAYFFPQFVLPVFIVLSAVFMRWMNILIVKAAKYAKSDNDRCVAALNECVKMVNDHSALIKRVRLMENDIDDLERDSAKFKREMKR